MRDGIGEKDANKEKRDGMYFVEINPSLLPV
jgi:hypothetical protein